MSKILFLNHAQIGHLNPLLTIALQMQADGHSTEFLIPGIEGVEPKIDILKTAFLIPKIVKKAGLEVEIIPPPLLAGVLTVFLPFFYGYKEFMFVVEISSIGLEKYTKSIIKHIEKNKPDMMVTDFAFYPAYIASEVNNIPCATVYHSGLPFKGKLVPPFASGLPIGENAYDLGKKFFPYQKFILDRLNRRINRVRKTFGLSEIAAEMFLSPYSKWLNLVTSAEAIEAPRYNLTENTFFIGPCFENRKQESNDFPFDKLSKDKYKVYVSLGTVFNNKPWVFEKIIKALGNKNDYQVIISAGGAYSKLSTCTMPENVLLFPRVPQVDLLAKIDLVIGHGGNNTTNETLAAGKPLIIMPIGGEQGDNGSRVEYLGAGIKIDIHNFNEKDLEAKVNFIRTTKEFQKRTTELKHQLEKTSGAKTASKLIEWVAEKKQPLIRPKHLPLTFTLEYIKELYKL
ncbi:MAG: glycosyltransferase family 1 protein [Acidobacteria bacterium]|nr:glycosyltransferase family 1 protein [Acidobacteriota bacterium]